MNRNFGISFLILCFILSSVDAALADQIVGMPQAIQPYNLQSLNQQIVEQDRINRDQEIAIRGLIDDNQRLAQLALAGEQDANLEEIEQTMTYYRNYLLSRDQARIMANGLNASGVNGLRPSRYDDLIRLTEDVDNSKGFGHTMQLKNDVIDEKYQTLTDLKNELTLLNEKLKIQAASKNENQVTPNTNQVTPQQEEKIQILTQRLAEMDQRISRYDSLLAEKDQEIAQLKSNLASLQGGAADKEVTLKQSVQQLSQQQQQLDLLKSEIENKIANENNLNQEVSSKSAVINQQQNQIAALQTQAQSLATKEQLMKSQADQMVSTLEQYKGQSTAYTNLQAEVKALRDKIHQQDADLNAKDDSIRWLNKVLVVAKDKAEYFRLTSQKDQLSTQQVQEEVKNIKDDFAQRSKDYDQFENAVTALKAQVGQLTTQLSQKQQQVDLLKSELENKITEENNQSQQQAQAQEAQQELKAQLQDKQHQITTLSNQTQQDAQADQTLKSQLQDKEDQIAKMKANIQQLMVDQSKKESSSRMSLARTQELIGLAKQLIGLQEEEASLLREIDILRTTRNAVFEQRVLNLQNKIQQLLASQQRQVEDMRSRMDVLQGELNQKEQEVGTLKTELENKISQEKSQAVLMGQIQHLTYQLQDKENQISSMKTVIQSGQQTQAEMDTMKNQLADQQNKVVLLKQELENKITQSNQMGSMLRDYQQKLESKNSTYNEQLQQMLVYKNLQGQMHAQVVDLNVQLQEKESQLVKIKKDMYDLQKAANSTETDTQTKDLSLFMMQKNMMDEKINEYQSKVDALQATNDKQAQEIVNLKAQLALARQQLVGMPSSDELEFLRTGLHRATVELKQKDAMISQIKANADEYEKEYKQQSQDFQSLKDQLQDAQEEIGSKNEDLKYKDMEITRIKVRSKMAPGDLQKQIQVLTQKLNVAEKKLHSKGHVGKAEELQEQLDNANLQIKDLRKQLEQLISPFKNDPEGRKLKQALDKIDEQGRVITVLAQKLQDCGQSVDLTKIIGK